MNVVDIAEMFTDWGDELGEDKRIVLAFRILPKEISAEVFSYLDRDRQQQIVEAISDKELG
ncbi:MAG: magnesium transporter, partial [Oscillospiraceae bacterium]